MQVPDGLTVMREEVPCHRVKREIVAALSRLTTVRRIASFAAIRAAKPICFYRMFTGVPQPSGRYWFADESPFHRIDISFYLVADYLALCHDRSKNGHAITMREEYSAAAAPDPMRDRSSYTPVPAVVIQPHETQAGCCLYFHLEAVKDRMRGRRGKRDSRDTHAALARVIEESGAVTFGGGDFIGLAKRCLGL